MGVVVVVVREPCRALRYIYGRARRQGSAAIVVDFVAQTSAFHVTRLGFFSLLTAGDMVVEA